MSARETIAVIGGTGNIGYGLALRWADAGYAVIVGSRAREKAEEAARRLNAALGEERVEGAPNPEAAARADIACLTVPFAAQRPTLEQIREAVQGKILIDVTVPLVPPKVNRVQLPPEGSAARITQMTAGEGVRVVSAFQNVGAKHLEQRGHPIDCDVLVTGDDREARARVVGLARDIGLRGLDAGPLDNAVAAEALTSVLIWFNQRHKVPGTGIRITGLPEGI